MLYHYLRVNLEKAQQELDDTTYGVMLAFHFLIDLYKHHLIALVEAKSGDARAACHSVCTLRSHLLVLDGKFMPTTLFY